MNNIVKVTSLQKQHLGGDYFLRDWKIKSKLFFVAFIFIVIIIADYGFEIVDEIKANRKHLESLEKNVRDNYDNIIKSQLETVVSVVEVIRKEYTDEKINLQEAKEIAAEYIRNISYGEEGYFWVDTEEGLNIVLYGSDVEGTNRYEFQDVNGKYIIKEIIAAALNGGGFTDYYFPKIGEEEPQPKRSYSVYYEPFRWIIGTGIYTNDIEDIIKIEKDEFADTMLSHFYMRITVYLFIFFVLIFALYILSVNIKKPLEYIAFISKKIADGDYNEKIPDSYLKRGDELGEVIRAVHKMRDSINDLVVEKDILARDIMDEKIFFSTTMKSIGDGVITIDMVGRITFVNEVALSVFGISEPELLKNYYEDIFMIHKENTKSQRLEEIKETLRNVKRSIFIENSILSIKSIGDFQVEVSISPILRDGIVTGVVFVFRDAEEKNKKHKAIEYLSYHDQMTDLYNRRYFEEQCKKIDNEINYPLSIIVADLNGLKLINDVYGHHAGDEYIKTFSKVIKGCVRDKDIVSRTGGDEFIILLPETGFEEVKYIIGRVKEKLKAHSVENVPVTAAFGFETRRNKEIPLSEFIKRADGDMYDHKFKDSEVVKENMIRAIFDGMFQFVEKSREYYENISNMSVKIAEKIHVDDIKNIKIAGLFHDIGYITINKSIFMKESELSIDEKYEIQNHPVAGYHILNTILSYGKIAEIVLAHHENYDGSGYPEGIRGDEIPIESRILSVVVSYYAMTSEKRYGKIKTKEEAIREINKLSGKMYDPVVVNAFMEIVKDH